MITKYKLNFCDRLEESVEGDLCDYDEVMEEMSLFQPQTVLSECEPLHSVVMPSGAEIRVSPRRGHGKQRIIF
jgi:hypothetical protein